MELLVEASLDDADKPPHTPESEHVYLALMAPSSMKKETKASLEAKADTPGISEVYGYLGGR